MTSILACVFVDCSLFFSQYLFFGQAVVSKCMTVVHSSCFGRQLDFALLLQMASQQMFRRLTQPNFEPGRPNNCPELALNLPPFAPPRKNFPVNTIRGHRKAHFTQQSEFPFPCMWFRKIVDGDSKIPLYALTQSQSSTRRSPRHGRIFCPLAFRTLGRNLVASKCAKGMCERSAVCC